MDPTVLEIGICGKEELTLNRKRPPADPASLFGGEGKETGLIMNFKLKVIFLHYFAILTLT